MHVYSEEKGGKHVEVNQPLKSTKNVKVLDYWLALIKLILSPSNISDLK